uniref:Uncharacterized protein n=1 Tax=Oryza meridionalis TaxID=40149 RepID=A0A0E0EIL2_9ORYZ
MAAAGQPDGRDAAVREATGVLEVHGNSSKVHHDPSPYLEEDPRGDELPVTLPEKNSKRAALPDLVQDDDAERGSGQRQQQQKDIGNLLAGTGHGRALRSVLAPIHHFHLPLCTPHLLPILEELYLVWEQIVKGAGAEELLSWISRQDE